LWFLLYVIIISVAMSNIVSFIFYHIECLVSNGFFLKQFVCKPEIGLYMIWKAVILLQLLLKHMDCPIIHVTNFEKLELSQINLKDDKDPGWPPHRKTIKFFAKIGRILKRVEISIVSLISRWGFEFVNFCAHNPLKQLVNRMAAR